MNHERWMAVDHYITDLFVPADAALDAALVDSAATGLPSIHVSPNQGKLLHILARTLHASAILEIGTLGGYSTIWLARALEPGGRLITLESNPNHAEVARANIARAGLSDIVDLRLGRALDTLPGIFSEGQDAGAKGFDLVFVDADKPSAADYFSWAMRLAHAGSLIIVDNVVRKGGVIDAASPDVNIQGVRHLNELMAAEPRVVATVVQTVGSKGYDGFAVGLVTSDAA